MNRHELIDDSGAEHFVQQCKRELVLYPRSPVIVERQTAIDIDMSGIMRMTPEQIAEALRTWEAAA
jgi:hypothetical protein